MRYSEIKKLIQHLRKGRWAEVQYAPVKGYFDITCIQHLKDYRCFGQIKKWRAL